MALKISPPTQNDLQTVMAEFNRYNTEEVKAKIEQFTQKEIEGLMIVPADENIVVDTVLKIIKEHRTIEEIAQEKNLKNFQIIIVYKTDPLASVAYQYLYQVVPESLL